MTWEGTVIFDVAPANAHAVTTVALEAVIATSSSPRCCPTMQAPMAGGDSTY